MGKPSADPAVQQAISFGTVPGFSFAFQVLPTIIFFSALLSILYYLGIMQKVVLLFAKIMAKTMKVSGAESLSNSANIFVGQTEAPLVVAPYIEKMTRSELMAIMVGGFSNTAGGVLGAYVMMLQGYFPNIAGHLITASLLSAPAAFSHSTPFCHSASISADMPSRRYSLGMPIFLPFTDAPTAAS